MIKNEDRQPNVDKANQLVDCVLDGLENLQDWSYYGSSGDEKCKPQKTSPDSIYAKVKFPHVSRRKFWFLSLGTFMIYHMEWLDKVHRALNKYQGVKPPNEITGGIRLFEIAAISRQFKLLSALSDFAEERTGKSFKMTRLYWFGLRIRNCVLAFAAYFIGVIFLLVLSPNWTARWLAYLQCRYL